MPYFRTQVWRETQIIKVNIIIRGDIYRGFKTRLERNVTVFLGEVLSLSIGRSLREHLSPKNAHIQGTHSSFPQPQHERAVFLLPACAVAASHASESADTGRGWVMWSGAYVCLMPLVLQTTNLFSPSQWCLTFYILPREFILFYFHNETSYGYNNNGNA